jgi:adenine-specific DNA-methyltransferase
MNADQSDQSEHADNAPAPRRSPPARKPAWQPGSLKARDAAHDPTPGPARASPRDGVVDRRAGTAPDKPPLTRFTTTLWTYPSQHYDAWVDDEGRTHRSKARAAPRPNAYAMQGDQAYVGATPSWVIWQCLMRFTKPGDRVIDPMCGSGTTLDVCRDLDRQAVAFDLNPQRPEIVRADARQLPVSPGTVDFAFIDPPYSTHVDYSNDPRCIGKLDAAGEDDGYAYFASMAEVFEQLHRALKPGAALALYVSDTFRFTQRAKRPLFVPIGPRLLNILADNFEPIDIVAVVRRNQKLERGQWHKAAAEQNFLLRGFNYLFLVRKPERAGPAPTREQAAAQAPRQSARPQRDRRDNSRPPRPKR